MIVREISIFPAAIAVLLSGAAEIAAAGVPDQDEGAAGRRGVTLYEHDSFRGRHETFYGDDANLRDNSVGNDRVSSVRVAPGCTVTLYQHADYQGFSTTLRHDAAELGSSAVGNDAVSSIEVRCDASEASGTDDPADPGLVNRTNRDSFKQSFQVATAERRRLGRPEDPETLKELAVMITVTFDDESEEHGAGVVLCQENRQAYVLTAHHVLAGKEPEGAERTLRLPVRLEIRFLHESVPSVAADLASGASPVVVHRVADEDLDLLSVPGLRKLKVTVAKETLHLHPAIDAYLQGASAPGVRPAEWARAVEPRIVAIGYRKSPMETWAVERGTLLPGDGRLFRHSAAIVEGFSGGPLFHESGALIGLNLELIAGEEIGAEADTYYGEALAIDDVLPRIGPWLPERCLRNMEEEIERHHDAMAATVFFATADEMKKAGSRGKFRFGPYRITGAHGIWIPTLGSNMKRKFKFSFDESNGSLWQGKCTEIFKTIGEEQESSDAATGLEEVMNDYALSCALERRDTAETVELVLHERKIGDNVEGAGTAGAVRIETAVIRAEASYVLHADNRILGAVTAEPTSVWLDPSVKGETRSTCVLIAAALLLHSGFEMIGQ